MTTQTKALDEYFLIVAFTLLLNRVHVFANFMLHLDRETWQYYAPKGSHTCLYINYSAQRGRKHRSHAQNYQMLWSNITLSFFSQTPKQLNKEYKRRIKELNYTYNTYSAFAYDAVWSIALMLDQSEALLQKRNSSLKELAFGNKEASEIFVRLLNRTNFPGMSVSPVIHIRKFYFNCNNFKYVFNSICIYYCTTCRIFRKVLISMEFLFFFMIIQKMTKLPVRTL